MTYTPITKRLEMPWSEVCMHMKIAGTIMLGELLPNGMVQLYTLDGAQFSFPITAGEAGWSMQ